MHIFGTTFINVYLLYTTVNKGYTDARTHIYFKGKNKDINASDV